MTQASPPEPENQASESQPAARPDSLTAAILGHSPDARIDVPFDLPPIETGGVPELAPGIAAAPPRIQRADQDAAPSAGPELEVAALTEPHAGPSLAYSAPAPAQTERLSGIPGQHRPSASQEGGPVSGWIQPALQAAEREDWEHAEQLLLPHRQHPAALHLLGLIRRAQGRPAEALACFEAALQRGGVVELHAESARLLHELGRFREAQARYEQILADGQPLADPDQHRYAHCLRETGQPQAALGLYEALLTRYPGHAALWMHCGNARLDLGQAPAAREAYARSLAISPDDPLTRYNLARCLHRLGEAEAAETALLQSLTLMPDLIPAINLLGSLQQAGGRTLEALASFERAVALKPNDALSLNNLGTCLQALYRGEAAEAAYRAALEREPGLREARLNLAQLLRQRSLPEQAAEALAPLLDAYPPLRYLDAFLLPVVQRSPAQAEHWIARLRERFDRLEAEPVPLMDPALELGQLPFYLPYLPVAERPLIEQLGRIFTKACPGMLSQPVAAGKRQSPSGGKWRIGLLSGYFTSHTVWHLFGYLLRYLPREHFEVVAIHCGPTTDAITAAIQAQADQFVQLPANLAACQAQIVGLGLDLLFWIDLGMEPSSYFLAASRLAPLQLMTWGHPLSSGLPEIDGFVISPGLVPPASAGFYREPLLEAPEFFACWQPPEELSASPADFGLPAKPLYLCPQSLYKLAPDYDELLIRLLEADPEGQLVLVEGLYPDWRAQLEARWAGRLDPARLHWLPRLSGRDFVRLVDCGQVMLDPRPYGGGLTMMQAAAQGVPLVSWPTERLKGRLALGLCQALDWNEGLVGDAESYVGTAVRLAHSWSEADRAALKARYREVFEPRRLAAGFGAWLAALCEQRLH